MSGLSEGVERPSAPPPSLDADGGDVPPSESPQGHGATSSLTGRPQRPGWGTGTSTRRPRERFTEGWALFSLCVALALVGYAYPPLGGYAVATLMALALFCAFAARKPRRRR